MTPLELRAALQRLGLRQGKFARVLGVHRATVKRWVGGELPVPGYVAAYLELAEQVCALLPFNDVWKNDAARRR